MASTLEIWLDPKIWKARIHLQFNFELPSVYKILHIASQDFVSQDLLGCRSSIYHYFDRRTTNCHRVLLSPSLSSTTFLPSGGTVLQPTFSLHNSKLSKFILAIRLLWAYKNKVSFESVYLLECLGGCESAWESLGVFGSLWKSLGVSGSL